MPSTSGGILGWNIEKYSTLTERSDWFVLRAYVIYTYISNLHSVHLKSVSLASLACQLIEENHGLKEFTKSAVSLLWKQVWEMKLCSSLTISLITKLREAILWYHILAYT